MEPGVIDVYIDRRYVGSFYRNCDGSYTLMLWPSV